MDGDSTTIMSGKTNIGLVKNSNMYFFLDFVSKNALYPGFCFQDPPITVENCHVFFMSGMIRNRFYYQTYEYKTYIFGENAFSRGITLISLSK